MPAGRPTKYKPEFCKQAAALSRLGATDREMAEFFEVNETTFHLWKTTHPEFSKSIKLAKAAADKRVERSLYQRALGYSHDAVKIFCDKDNGVTQVPYVEQYPPETTACIFWLKNRKPEVWRDRKDVEVKGSLTLTDLIKEATESAQQITEQTPDTNS